MNAKTLAGSITHSGGLDADQGLDRGHGDRLHHRDGAGAQAHGTAGHDAASTSRSLDLGAARTAISGRSVTVGPVAAKLTKGAADALNQAFATTAFTEGLVVGTATVSGTAA